MPLTGSVVLAVLVFSTVVFAINIFDLFSIFYLLAQDLNADVSLLGMISAAMAAGIGLLQIPAGILAAKQGPKNVATIGMIVISFSAGLIAISSDLSQIVALRFVFGAGLAFFFPSAIVLGTQYFRKGSEGLGAGIIVGSNAAGGMLGLVAWAIIAAIVGWRSGIAVGAILACIAAALMYLVLPKELPRTAPFIIKRCHVRALIADKYLILVGITLLGGQVTFEQVLGFMPFYLQQVLEIEPPVAGLVGSIALLTALVGSPIMGWLYDRKRNLSLLCIPLAGAMLVGVSLNYFQVLTAAVASSAIAGFVGGGLFTLLSNAGRERAVTGKQDHNRIEYTTLSVNWVHAIALVGTIWAPIFFSSSVLQYGYSTAWPLIGALSFGIIIVTSVAILRSRMHVVDKLGNPQG
jgi:MFS family permease